METEDLDVEQGFVAASELRQEKLDAVDKAVRSPVRMVQGKVFNMNFSVFAEEKGRFSCFRGMDPHQLPETFRW
jgi:hypothetical protein